MRNIAPGITSKVDRIGGGIRDDRHQGTVRTDEQGINADGPAPEGPTFGTSTSDMPPIERLSAEVDAWIKTTGIRYFDPLTNMAILTEEVGEVARIMARRYGEQSEKPADRTKDLGEELADVLFVVLCLANQTNTDLQHAWTKKMRKRTTRDRSRHAANRKLR